MGWVALLMGMVTGANAQVNDTIQRTGQRPISGDYTEVTLPADGDAPRGTGDVCQDGAYHLPLGGAVRGLGKQLDHSRESGRCGERDPGEGDHRGVSGGNELFPLSARTEVSIRSMPGMRMSRRC